MHSYNPQSLLVLCKGIRAILQNQLRVPCLSYLTKCKVHFNLLRGYRSSSFGRGTRDLKSVTPAQSGKEFPDEYILVSYGKLFCRAFI